jgi:hypothetical protein
MKAKSLVVFAGAILALGPVLGFSATKEVREFPSSSIRPLIATETSESSVGQRAPERRVTPLPERTTAPNPRSCAKPFVARDAAEDRDRRECQPENGILTQADIPQLRAFRQPNTQKFAP